MKSNFEEKNQSLKKIKKNQILKKKIKNIQILIQISFLLRKSILSFPSLISLPSLPPFFPPPPPLVLLRRLPLLSLLVHFFPADPPSQLLLSSFLLSPRPPLLLVLLFLPPLRRKKEKMPQTFVGRVVSVRMQKTVNVLVDRFRKDSRLRKVFRTTKKFMTHDENEVANHGDIVRIVQSRPHSKCKAFELESILQRAPK